MVRLTTAPLGVIMPGTIRPNHLRGEPPVQLIELGAAAARYQVSIHTLRNYIRSAQLTSYGAGKTTQVDCAELNAIFMREPATPTQRIFAVCNHKGGVGKTTTASALGWFLARRGPTLMIDADPQGHLTQVFGLDSDRLERTLYEVMVKALPIQEAMFPIQLPEVLQLTADAFDPDALRIVGSNLELAETTLQVTGRPWWAKILRTALRPVLSDFQYVVIDCPPSLDSLTVNAI